MIKHGDQILDAVCVRWNAGLSGTEIGKHLGLSRDSVKALVRRLRALGRVPPSYRKRVRSSPKTPNEDADFNDTGGAAKPSAPATQPILGTSSATCQWLDGNPKHFMWCGLPAVAGSPWCETHYRLCVSRPARPIERNALHDAG